MPQCKQAQLEGPPPPQQVLLAGPAAEVLAWQEHQLDLSGPALHMDGRYSIPQMSPAEMFVAGRAGGLEGLEL